MERQIIIDTSSILFALSNRKDLFAIVQESLPSYTIVISEGVLGELKKLAKSKKGSAGGARLALSIIESLEIQVVKDSSYVDSWVVSEWEKRNCAVCTNDSELKKRLTGKGAMVVTVTKDGKLR